MEYVMLHSKEYFQSDEEIRIFHEKIEDFHSAHAHEFIEIVYIASGSGVQIIGGNKEDISKGDLFLINANVLHEFKSDSNNPLIVYNCIFEPFLLDRSFKNCKNFVDVAFNYTLHTLYEEDSKEYIKLSGIHHGKIETLLYEMHSEITERQNGYRHILKTDLLKLLIYIFRVYKDDDSQKQDEDVYKKLIVQNTIAFIKEHYCEDIKCEFLAKQSYISTGHLNKIFKEINGMTIIETLQNIRINIACEMLETTKKSVEKIALEVGYSDKKFFYELFKRKKSLSPGGYRKKHGKK